MQFDQAVTADQFRSLIGDPPLMKDESVEEFWTWWNAFVSEYEPKRLSDWYEVNEFALIHWEQRRISRCASAHVNGGLVLALKLLLLRVHPGIPDKIAEDYYCDDEKKKRKAREIVEGYGITDDQIRASSMRRFSKELLIFDRMKNYRASANRSSRREMDRRAGFAGLLRTKTMTGMGPNHWRPKSKSRPTAPMRDAAPAPRRRLASKDPAATPTAMACRDRSRLILRPFPKSTRSPNCLSMNKRRRNDGCQRRNLQLPR